MNIDRAQQWPGWRSRPLCGNYLAVFLNELSTVTGNLDRTECVTFKWALGAIQDGRCEVLGWWSHQTGCAVAWSAVAGDLSARGVERIRVVVESHHNGNGGLAKAGAAFQTVASALQPGASAKDLLARQQRHVVRASEIAGGAQLLLKRAVTRQGTFECFKAATSFVDEELQRLDRRLWSDSAISRAGNWQLRKPAPARQFLFA